MKPLSYRARRRWALLILLIGLPVYILSAVSVVTVFDRPGTLVELLIYVVLGGLWALPFRMIFSGVGRPDPDAASTPDPLPPEDGSAGGRGAGSG